MDARPSLATMALLLGGRSGRIFAFFAHRRFPSGMVRGPSTSLRMTDFLEGGLRRALHSGRWCGLRRLAVGGYRGSCIPALLRLRRWGHRRLPGELLLRRFLLSRWLFCLEASVEGWFRGPSTSLRMTDFLEGGLRRALHSGRWGGFGRAAVGGYRLNCIPALLRLRRWGHRRLPLLPLARRWEDRGKLRRS
jgi:hypothetical protein